MDSGKVSAREQARRDQQQKQSYRENENAREHGTTYECKRILSYRDLRDKKGIPFSRQWLRKLIAAGKFPGSVKIGEASVGFVESEVDEWIADCIRQRDGQAATTKQLIEA